MDVLESYGGLRGIVCLQEVHVSTLESAALMFRDHVVVQSLREPGQGGGIITVIPQSCTVTSTVREKYYVGVNLSI